MPQRPRGTRDFGPSEMAVREHVADRIRDVFVRYGYGAVQTPTFEELELFVAKSGEGIITELYDFEDKSGRRMTLRPELTAPAMRFYFAEHAFDPKPVKWYYFSNCFRYDRPQAGRYREFWQFGCEQMGAGGAMAYAELVALADACLRAAGLTDFRLGLGHVRILGAAVDMLGLDAAGRSQAMRTIDKGDAGALRALLEEAGVAPVRIEAFAELLGARAVGPAREAATRLGLDAAAGGAAGAGGAGGAGAAGAAGGVAWDELEACLEDLRELGVPVRLELSIARGLDYYTGIVFEAHVDALGAQSQVLGGGGYDLAAVFGAQSTPTMGFGLGFDRVVEAAGQQGALTVRPAGPAVAFGWLSAEARVQVLRWTRELRSRGVHVEMDLLGRKPGKVAEWASAIGADNLVIVGDRDLEADMVQVKRLETGESQTVPLGDLVACFAP